MPYFAPNQSKLNYLKHLVIPVWNWNKPMSKKDMALYMAHFNQKKDTPDDWFYDSIMPFITAAPSGNPFLADVNRGTTRNGYGNFYAIPFPSPANLRDWKETIDGHFADNGPLVMMNNLVPELTQKIGKSRDHKINVVITLPYPSNLLSLFGKLKSNKPSLNFSVTAQNLMQASEQRLEACCWYVDEILKRWNTANYKNLNLLGFYWIHETLRYSWDIDDHWVIKELYKHIRHRKSRFFWIPFYSSYNVRLLNDYEGFYFDCAILQPNHIFYEYFKDVKQAALEARDRNAGFEMEYYFSLPKKLGVNNEKYRRFRNYLNGGIKYGYMKDSVCGHFIGNCSIPDMYNCKIKIEHELLEDLYHFVKGDYQLKEGNF